MLNFANSNYILVFVQEIAFNIQQTEALTRSLSPSNVIEQQSFSRSASHTSFDAQSLRRNKQRLEEEQAYARSLAEQVCNWFFFGFRPVIFNVITSITFVP